MKTRTYLQKKAFTIIIGAFLFLTLIGTKVDGQVLPFGNPFPRFLYFYVPPPSPLMSPLLAPSQPLSANTYHPLREANVPTSITTGLTSTPTVLTGITFPFVLTGITPAQVPIPIPPAIIYLPSINPLLFGIPIVSVLSTPYPYNLIAALTIIP